nr:MAG TPA: hypothetical protein [Caudoviricetes sp.]
MINNQKIEALIIYSTRYCLGRNSYAIDETIAIAKEIDLSKETVDILLVDINHYLENANVVQASQSWLDFKKYLEEKYYEN